MKMSDTESRRLAMDISRRRRARDEADQALLDAKLAMVIAYAKGVASFKDEKLLDEAITLLSGPSMSGAGHVEEDDDEEAEAA
jgi:hypothetical protein